MSGCQEKSHIKTQLGGSTHNMCRDTMIHLGVSGGEVIVHVCKASDQIMRLLHLALALACIVLRS